MHFFENISQNVLVIFYIFVILQRNQKQTTSKQVKNIMKTYTTKQINREWKIKVYGIINGVKVNTLVGVKGLLRILGSMEKLQKFVGRAFKTMADKVACKVYGQPLTITFYAH